MPEPDDVLPPSTYRVGCVRVTPEGLSRRVVVRRIVEWGNVAGFSFTVAPEDTTGEPTLIPEHLLVVTYQRPIALTRAMRFGEWRADVLERKSTEMTVCVLGPAHTVLDGPVLPWRRAVERRAARLMADLASRVRGYQGPAERRRWVEAIWSRHGRDPQTGRLLDVERQDPQVR